MLHRLKFLPYTGRYRYASSYKEKFLEKIKKLNPSIIVLNDIFEMMKHEESQQLSKPKVAKLINLNSLEFGVEFKFCDDIYKIIKVSKKTLIFLKKFYLIYFYFRA